MIGTGDDFLASSQVEGMQMQIPTPIEVEIEPLASGQSRGIHPRPAHPDDYCSLLLG